MLNSCGNFKVTETVTYYRSIGEGLQLLFSIDKLRLAELSTENWAEIQSRK